MRKLTESTTIHTVEEDEMYALQEGSVVRYFDALFDRRSQGLDLYAPGPS